MLTIPDELKARLIDALKERGLSPPALDPRGVGRALGARIPDPTAAEGRPSNPS